MPTTDKGRDDDDLIQIPKRGAEPDKGSESRTSTVIDDHPRCWNVRLPADLIERAHQACSIPEIQDREDIDSLVAFTFNAFEQYLYDLQQDYNGGEPFERRRVNPFSKGRPPRRRAPRIRQRAEE